MQPTITIDHDQVVIEGVVIKRPIVFLHHSGLSFGNVPSMTMKMTRLAKMSEAALQTHVAKLLNAYARPEVCWWACPNGEQRSARTGQRLKQQGVKAGAPDLMFVKAGQFIGLELKTEIGTLSPKQHAFKEELERAGGQYRVAFGLEQAIAALIDLNVFRSNIHISLNALLK